MINFFNANLPASLPEHTHENIFVEKLIPLLEDAELQTEGVGYFAETVIVNSSLNIKAFVVRKEEWKFVIGDVTLFITLSVPNKDKFILLLARLQKRQQEKKNTAQIISAIKALEALGAK